MKNVSNEFKEIIKKGGPFYAYADMVLSDGTELSLDSENDFYIDGNSYTESSGDGFPLGAALAKTIDIGIDNSDERFSKYDFYYARITLYTETDLPSGKIEKIKEGTFTVISALAPGDIIEITASDDMYKSDKEYTSKLDYPLPALRVLQEVCTQCDINLGSVSFTNDDFLVQKRPEGLTGRQVIGYIAQIAGGNALFDENNRLLIKTYDYSVFEQHELITGGQMGDSITDKISAGTFGDNLQNYISGGEFGENNSYHLLSEFASDPEIATDDVVITGISATGKEEDEEVTYLYGTDDYVLAITNPLIEGEEEAAIKLIGDIVIGIIVRPFSGEFFPDPTIQFMDPVYLVDKKDNIYQSFITEHVFNYLGNSSLANATKSPEKNNSSYYSEATEVYRKSREEAKRNRIEWEKAMEELKDRVDNSSGLYMTKELQPDGSNIYYMHNKPTLEESMIVWKMTAEAMAVSTDGGKTYNAGLTVDGELIAKIMNTIGINFDWGVGGTLIIQTPSGEQTLYVNAKTGDVRIVATSFTLKGKSVEEIAEEQVNNFVSSVYDPKIAELQKQIDGQIETWYYDYQPTLSNIPASNWKTESDRAKHEGDLFYWKSKGYAYRFFKNGSTWTWQMVQDTDVTKALQQAAEAQDTADAKRRVFVVTPIPPYEVGDLWVGNSSSDLKRCQTTRSSGNYVSSDWIKAVKYTDDSALTAFVNGDFKETIEEVKTQADKKAETWYQSTDPSTAWTTTDLKNEHKGDIWFNTSSSVQKSYRWSGTAWQEMKTTPPDEVFDKIDGKAQVFVSTPKPPYEKGDLWFNSSTSDIMTCVTSRASGSYVSSDWQKRNKYTDDTKANEALEESKKARTLNIILDNEYQGIPTDANGNYNSFPECKTKVQVFFGALDISTLAAYKVTASSGVTGQWDDENRTYTVTALSKDSGYVDIQSTYLGLIATKRFSIVKQKQGLQGTSGKDGRTYYLQTSANVIKKGAGGELFPKKLEFSSVYTTGTNVTPTAYAGRFIIEESSNGSTWKEMYRSSADETKTSFDLYDNIGYSGNTIGYSGNTMGTPKENVKMIRCSLYKAGGFTSLIDRQSATIVIDVESLTQKDIFDIFTSNGELQGVYLLNGQLYINASYLGIGTISDKTGSNYWNLETGEMVIRSGKIDITADNKDSQITMKYIDDSNPSVYGIMRSKLKQSGYETWYSYSVNDRPGANDQQTYSRMTGFDISGGTLRGDAWNDDASYSQNWSINSETGNARFANVTQTSDKRVKENVSDITVEEAETFLSALHPVYFNYIGEKRNVSGFIAQEVEEASQNKPFEMVETMDDGLLTLSYSDFIAPIVKVIQKQQLEIQKLKERLEK